MTANDWMIWGYGFLTGSVVGLCVAILLSIRLCAYWYDKAKAAGVPVPDFATHRPGDPEPRP
jgi:hypothetical protein